MQHHRFIIGLNRSILIGTLLLLLLEGCASSPSHQIQASTNQNSMITSAPIKIYGSQVTMPGLFTVFTNGVDTFLNDGYCRGLALAADRLTYTRAELQNMYSYLENRSSPIPKTLKWVDGAPTTSNPNFGSKSIYMPRIQSCATDWEMTNIGQKPIRLMQVHMKLLSDTAEADKEYRLFDTCSVINEFNSSAAAACGIGGRPSQSTYTFSFGEGKAGSVVQGKSLVGEPVINPGETLFLLLNFLPANPSDALTYTIEPEFVINTSKEIGKVIDFPQWQETFVMAPSNRFGCYVLKDSTFISAISAPKDLLGGGADCL